MTDLSISRFFEQALHAPFRNIRWSWGSVDEPRKRIFLRLWADDVVIIDRVRHIRILEKHMQHDTRPGMAERQEHVTLMRSGAYEAFGVRCERNGPGAPIRDYNDQALIRLGALTEEPDHVAAAIVGVVSLVDLR